MEQTVEISANLTHCTHSPASRARIPGAQCTGAGRGGTDGWRGRRAGRGQTSDREGGGRHKCTQTFLCKYHKWKLAFAYIQMTNSSRESIIIAWIWKSVTDERTNIQTNRLMYWVALCATKNEISLIVWRRNHLSFYFSACFRFLTQWRLWRARGLSCEIDKMDTCVALWVLLLCWDNSSAVRRYPAVPATTTLTTQSVTKRSEYRNGTKCKDPDTQLAIIRYYKIEFFFFSSSSLLQPKRESLLHGRVSEKSSTKKSSTSRTFFFKKFELSNYFLFEIFAVELSSF